MKQVYTLKIGYCEKFNIKIRTVVHEEVFSAPTLDIAKRRATTTLKKLSAMQKYIKDRYSRKVRWTAWGTETQHKNGDWFVNKKSDGIFDHPQTIGFVQLTWDKNQIPLL